MTPYKSELGLMAAMVAMAPVLLCQGRYVRRVTPKLPEAAGPRSGECGAGAGLGLLVLGDSAAAGVGVATQEEALVGRMVAGLKDRFRVTWRLEAETGATTRSTIARLKRLESGKTGGKRGGRGWGIGRDRRVRTCCGCRVGNEHGDGGRGGRARANGRRAAVQGGGHFAGSE